MSPLPKPIKVWPDSAGGLHKTVEEWRQVELELLLQPSVGFNGLPEMHKSAAQAIIDNTDAILAILTTGPTSRPGARKKAGTTQPRRAAKKAAPATPEQAQAGFAEMCAATEQVA